MTDEGWVEADDGLRLYYSIYGNGPQVVVMPGGFYVDEEFCPLADGRTLVFLHQRGRGRSDAVTEQEQAGIAREARDLETVRRHIEADRMILIGWSYVGMVTALYALEHPGRAERLVHLCSLGPHIGTYSDAIPEVQEKGKARLDPGAVSRLERLHDEGLPDEDPRRFAEEWYRVMLVRQFGDATAIERMRLDFCAFPNEWPDRQEASTQLLTPSFMTWDERDRLSSLDVAMLVVHGTEDLIPEACARDMAATVPDARLMTVDGSGHFPWLERPDVFFPAMERFLSGEWPEGAEDVTRA